MRKPDIEFPIDTPVKEVERVLTEHHAYVGGKLYPVDDDFEYYVLRSINSVQEALEFCDRLDRESTEFWGRPSVCTKARVARSWFSGETRTTWEKYPRAPLGHARRTHCICHEVGSFARRKR